MFDSVVTARPVLFVFFISYILLKVIAQIILIKINRKKTENSKVRAIRVFTLETSAIGAY